LVIFVTFAVFVSLLDQLHDALLRADDRFFNILENLYAGVQVVSTNDDRILYTNRKFNQMVNASQSHLPEGERSSILSIMGQSFAKLRRQEARTFPNPFFANEVQDPQSANWYLIQTGFFSWREKDDIKLGILLDITEQKLAEQLSRQNQEIMKDATRDAELAEIAATLAHEINQPLMAVSNYVEVCLMAMTKPQIDAVTVRDAMEKCKTQSLRASKIVAKTRQFLKRQTPHFVFASICSIVDDAIQMLELDIKQVSATVQVTSTKELPSVLVDRTLIIQVLCNLLLNAIDAIRYLPMDRRTITVGIQISADAALEISVLDLGAGISEAFRESIYESYFSTKPNGLGLGLSICKSVIEAHRGTLWHTGAAEAGTSFHFTLPLHKSYLL
jgi:signal transduction histidine kinase